MVSANKQREEVILLNALTLFAEMVPQPWMPQNLHRGIEDADMVGSMARCHTAAAQ